MRNTLKIASRGSHLSLAQVELFENRVREFYPDIKFERKLIKTSGDLNQSVSLELVEGSDFFTAEVQAALFAGEADFAVHSLKDVSNLYFFNRSRLAVFARESIHDIVIFNPDVSDKLKRGEELVIGTSSSRRAGMGLKYLKEVLPQFHSGEIRLRAETIRGNVDTRLGKLRKGDIYDGIILAIAGINRLLDYGPSKNLMLDLLRGCPSMLMSLFACPPAASQGAIAAECADTHKENCQILDKVNSEPLRRTAVRERKVAGMFGDGSCSQHFGTFSLKTKSSEFIFASGKNSEDDDVVYWDFEKSADISKEGILYFGWLKHKAYVSSEISTDVVPGNFKHVFISNINAVPGSLVERLKACPSVWAAGTQTASKLAKLGIWVSGTTDGLGLDYIDDLWMNTYYESFDRKDMLVLTNESSLANYTDRPEHAVATYRNVPTHAPNVIKRVSNSSAIFWTAFQQYRDYNGYLNGETVHMCGSGKTADKLRAAGVKPVIFPTIKAFKTWLNTK